MQELRLERQPVLVSQTVVDQLAATNQRFQQSYRRQTRVRHPITRRVRRLPRASTPLTLVANVDVVVVFQLAVLVEQSLEAGIVFRHRHPGGVPIELAECVQCHANGGIPS